MRHCLKTLFYRYIWLLVLLFGSARPVMADFEDVRDSAYYAYEPVYWALDRGITTGVSDTYFGLSEGSTRGQTVTFLWRAAGQPEPGMRNNPFGDVDPGKYYYKAVLWAYENEITRGTSANSFSPGEVCTREQIVTFLFRSRGIFKKTAGRKLLAEEAEVDPAELVGDSFEAASDPAEGSSDAAPDLAEGSSDAVPDLAEGSSEAAPDLAEDSSDAVQELTGASSASALVLIGDSRTVEMELALDRAGIPHDDVFFSARRGRGLEWMKDVGVPAAEDHIGAGTKVVITMGVNDALKDGIEKTYGTYLNEQAEKWIDKGAQVYFCTIPPTDRASAYTTEAMDNISRKIIEQLSNSITILHVGEAMRDYYVTREDDLLHYTDEASIAYFNCVVSAALTDDAACFGDVQYGRYAFEPVIWAVKNGITTGTAFNAFSPAKTCPRGETVTFLYRAAA